MKTLVLLLHLSISLFAAWLPAQTPSATEFFETKIRPVLVAKCQSCHGTQMQMAGLNLSNAAAFAKGSDNGPIVKPGDAKQSRLLRVISYEETIKMPPAGRLTPEEVANFRTWVEMGAPWPHARPASPKDQSHWAFQPVRPQKPHVVKAVSWVKSPIDRFILAKLEQKGLQPTQPASKATLLRRVSFDLTGLPPTEEELKAFLADTSPRAFARVVDRLLASPRYGEKWGRHWLDVARYADSTGVDEDHIYFHGWRYRDYVIEAFNQDLPYDRFVAEQVAGDLLPAEAVAINRRGIVATGFLALGPKPLAQQDRVRMVYDVIDEQIDTTGKAFHQPGLEHGLVLQRGRLSAWRIHLAFH